MSKSLSDLMEFEHVIEVREDGSIAEPSGMYAPEITLEGDAEGQVSDEAEAAMIAYVERQGWSLLRGFTGQYMAGDSPIMHPSEFIGGGLERHIRENPGYYVSVVIDVQPDAEDAESEMCGWGVAYRPLDWKETQK